MGWNKTPQPVNPCQESVWHPLLLDSPRVFFPESFLLTFSSLYLTDKRLHPPGWRWRSCSKPSFTVVIVGSASQHSGADTKLTDRISLLRGIILHHSKWFQQLFQISCLCSRYPFYNICFAGWKKFVAISTLCQLCLKFSENLKAKKRNETSKCMVSAFFLHICKSFCGLTLYSNVLNFSNSNFIWQKILSMQKQQSFKYSYKRDHGIWFAETLIKTLFIK